MTATILLPSKENVLFLSKKLAEGHLVAIPTETVYGLAADARNVQAVREIYKAKNRPILNPLIAHYHSLEILEQDVEYNSLFLKISKVFWPGPLTVVLKKKEKSKISEIATAGLNTVAVRIPSHPITQALLQQCDFPIVAPSANPSGKLSPVNALHVQKGLGHVISWILDGGESEKGLESTILDLSVASPILLRAGSITAAMIEKVLGEKCKISPQAVTVAKAPGMKYPHYAPSCELRLNTENPIENEALLAFGLKDIPVGYTHILNLSPSANLEEAAQNLFKFLHQLEDMKVSRISVMPIPKEGIGIAINDKLEKAALATRVKLLHLRK